MNEHQSGRSREIEPPAPIFGDVVTVRDFFNEQPVLVVEVAENDMLSAIGIMDEAQNRYSMPGTFAASDVIRTVGHKNFDDVVEALISAIASDSKPTTELRVRVRESLIRTVSSRTDTSQ